jgi:DNA-binding NarL/FixJ family response regulator
VDEVICRPAIPLRLLVVDDHEIVRVGLRNLLTSGTSDWHVCGEAEVGLEAIAKALELAPDVVILDLTMPKMNGIEAATENGGSRRQPKLSSSPLMTCLETSGSPAMLSCRSCLAGGS